MLLESFRISAVPVKHFEEAFELARQDSSGRKYGFKIENESLVKAARPSHTVLRLESDFTYLVAGRLRDLGKRFLRLTAKVGAKYLITLSRSVSNSVEHRSFEKELHILGAKCVLYSVKCSIANEASTKVALAEIKAKGLPTVKGVIQSTVVLRDSTLDTMSSEVFKSVLEAKVQGTCSLQRVFTPEGLIFFISLSSAVGIIGTSGQENYNPGNAVQDALAQFDQTSTCHSMPLNIGSIEGADAYLYQQ